MEEDPLQVTAAATAEASPGCSADYLRQSSWIEFNDVLNGDARSLLDENVIVRRLQALDEMENKDPRIWWLTLARINELAVMLAGAYADGCEFQAAGDLLVNPRRIDVYRRGCDRPVAKDRHRALSDQFAGAIGDENPVEWLCRETLTHIREAALLPHLREILGAAGVMSGEYLNLVDRRMRQVADTLAFLNAWQVEDSADLSRRLAAAAPGDRMMLEGNLCRFDRQPFDALGEEIVKIIMAPNAGGAFLGIGRTAWRE
jgi:hypothetical protein